MSHDVVGKAIFITNTFATANPELHRELWAQFEKEVPFPKRSGMYGADNVAYVRWLKAQKNEIVNGFLHENIIAREQ